MRHATVLTVKIGRVKTVCFVILLSLLTIRTVAQVNEATAKLDSNAILIGRQVHLQLELKHDRRQKFQWPAIPDSIGKIEVIERGKIDTVPSANTSQITRRQVVTITAFDSGYFVIPPFYFHAAEKGDTVTLDTRPLLLMVNTVPVDTTKAIHDIKAIAEVPFSWRDYIWYIIGGLLLALAIVLGIYIYRKLKRKEKLLPVPAKQSVPPHEEALSALRKLDEEKHWQNGRYKYYHSSLSEIIRTYIEQRWKINAMEQTTDEILNQFHLLRIDPGSQSELEKLLKLSDLAKFAKFQPLANENEQSMRDAVQFVKQHAITTTEENREVVIQ